MAKNPERAEKMRIKREQMENDPDLQAARESATQSILEKYANEGQKPETGGAPEPEQYDAETSADKTEAKVPPAVLVSAVHHRSINRPSASRRCRVNLPSR